MLVECCLSESSSGVLLFQVGSALAHDLEVLVLETLGYLQQSEKALFPYQAVAVLEEMNDVLWYSQV